MLHTCNPLVSCGSAARTAAGAMGRAEAGVERVLYRAGIARLSLDLGFSAKDSLDRCACRVPLHRCAAAVMHVCATDDPLVVCMLPGAHSYTRFDSTLCHATGQIKTLLGRRIFSSQVPIRHCVIHKARGWA